MLQHTADLDVVAQDGAIRALKEVNDKYKAKHKAEGKAVTNRMLLVIVIMIGVPMIGALIFDAVRKQSKPPVVMSTSVAPVVKPAVAPAPKIDPLEPIRETLRRIYSVDMDNDGKINCVDYTIQFYQYYPNRNDVRIIWSDNKNFNHLFVRVNGTDVEPGAYLRKSNTEKWFGMKKFWGDIYDPSYNRDVTNDYESIRDGTRWQ
jgi:hypothetical protein